MACPSPAPLKNAWPPGRSRHVTFGKQSETAVGAVSKVGWRGRPRWSDPTSAFVDVLDHRGVPAVRLKPRAEDGGNAMVTREYTVHRL